MLVNYPIQANVELTTHCNSKCLDCNRYIKGTSIINPNIDLGKKGMISLTAIDNLIADPELLRSINLTGTYGDGAWHPKFFEILEKFPEGIQLVMETNGGMKDTEFWKKFGSIVKEKFTKSSHVVFGIDGVDNESHQKYRRTVDFNKVIENAQAFMSSGAKARWSLIEFPHNTHLISTAESMAKHLGFDRFKIRRSRLRHRILDKKDINEQIPEIGEFNLTDSQSKAIEDALKSGKKLMAIGESVKSRNSSFDKEKRREYYNTTEVKCEWSEKQMISVDYTSRVWMCCNFSTFYHAQPGYVGEQLSSEQIRNRENLSWYEDQYDKHWNLLEHNTLKDILNHRFYKQDLEKSIKNNLDTTEFPRIERCAKHCGAMSRSIDKSLKDSGKHR